MYAKKVGLNDNSNFENRLFEEKNITRSLAPVVYITQNTKIHISSKTISGTGSLLTAQQIIFKSILEQLKLNLPQVLSIKDQIYLLKKTMGLTIAEIAQIMNVSRQAIYLWMEPDSPKLQSDRQERLNEICNIGSYWSEKKLGRLGNYLHKKINIENISLYALLLEENLRTNEIHTLIDRIAYTISIELNRKKSHEDLLKQHDFKKLTQEEMDKNLDSLIQKIG